MILPHSYLEQFTHYESTAVEGWETHYTLVKLFYKQWWKPFPKKIKIKWMLGGGYWREPHESLQLRDQLANYFYRR
jgi:hypothetical protein